MSPWNPPHYNSKLISVEPNPKFEPIFVLDTLKRFGFHDVESPYVSSGNSVAYPLKNGLIKADITCVNFVEFGLVLAVQMSSRSSLVNFHCQLPAGYESDEQALAMLVHSLKLDSKDFFGSIFPLWYQIGLQNYSLLPFAKAQAKFAARDRCIVSRTAFRPLIREALQSQFPVIGEIINISFDGAVLVFRGFSRDLKVAADGNEWVKEYNVLRSDFKNNPKRYISDFVSIDVWEGQFRIDNSVIGAVIEYEYPPEPPQTRPCP